MNMRHWRTNIILSDIMLCVVILDVIVLSAVILSVIMLNAVIVSVVALSKHFDGSGLILYILGGAWGGLQVDYRYATFHCSGIVHFILVNM
jgi:hypothetical protein